MRPERDSLIRGHAALMVRAAVPAMNTAFKNALRFMGSYRLANRFNYGRDPVSANSPGLSSGVRVHSGRPLRSTSQIRHPTRQGCNNGINQVARLDWLPTLD